MAGSIFDSTSFTNSLKDLYGPEIVYQSNDKVVALKLFMPSSDEWQGLQVKYPVGLERAYGFMAHGAMGIFPDAMDETTIQTTIGTKWLRGRIMFSKEVMEASRTSRGAWARANQYLMSRMVNNIARSRNRQLNSTGTGILALVDGAGSGTTSLNVDAPGGIAGDGFGSRFLQVGMRVAITDGTTITAVRQISSITTESDASSTIVFTTVVSAGDAPDNSYLVRAANLAVTSLTNDTSYNNEISGLEAMCDDGTLVGTFQNISRSTYPVWQATVINVPTFSLAALQQLTDTTDQVAGEPITDHLVHHSVRRLYLASVDSTRQFVQANKAPGMFDLGLEPQGMALSYNSRPIHVDQDARLGAWKVINRGHLFRYVLVEGEWATDVDNKVLKWVSSDQDAFEGRWRCSDNFATDQPNAHGQLTGLDTTNAIRRHVV